MFIGNEFFFQEIIGYYPDEPPEQFRHHGMTNIDINDFAFFECCANFSGQSGKPSAAVFEYLPRNCYAISKKFGVDYSSVNALQIKAEMKIDQTRRT